MAKAQQGMSEDTKTIIVVLLLIFAYPIGVILMWVWVKWPTWVKSVISIPFMLGILAVALAVIMVSQNPAKQFSDADDTKRRSDVSAIANAVAAYKTDNGTYPEGITEADQVIGRNELDLCPVLVNEYLAALPVDPRGGGNIVDCEGSLYSTYYAIRANADGTVTVTAQNAVEKPISVTR